MSSSPNSNTPLDPTPKAGVNSMFPGDTEMARLMRAFDWSQCELGPPEHWPETLKTCVRIILTSRHPMLIWRGDNLINIYNDGYATFLHARHPKSLGQPTRMVWPEIWDDFIVPRVEFAKARDMGTYDEGSLS